MNLTTIIAIGGFLIAVATFFIGQYTGTKKAGETKGSLFTDINYLKTGSDDIKRSLTIIKDRQHESELQTSSRLTSVEESAKQAHHRLNEHINNHD